MKNTIALIALFLAAAPAVAQNPFQTGDESTGIQKRKGDPSPAGGFSTGETNSRIDDYINQDEQINLDKDSGVVRVLRTNQKNLINDFVTVVVPIENVSPREIRNVMRTVCGMEGGRAEVIRDKVGGEQFVQLICPKFMVPYVTEAVRALDVKWLEQGRDGTITENYVTLYRPAATLDAIASNYAGEGASQLDVTLNTIVRRDEPYRVKKYMDACRLFDTPPPQALLKIRIYEVDTGNDLSLGVDWIAWKNGPGRSLFELIFGGQESHQRFDNATGHFDPNLGALTILNTGSHDVHAEATQYLLSANYLLTSAYLDFLRVKGKARVLAEPEVFVFSSKVGSWSSVDQTLAFETFPDDPGPFGIEPVRLNKVALAPDSEDFPDGFPQAEEVKSDFAAHNRFLNHRIRAEVGITLNVRPVVGTESSEVEIELISTEVSGVTPQGTPIITGRRLVNKVRLVDGQATVLATMSRTEDIDSSNKAPWLGDIPVLGYLFGQENNTSRQKEIVITMVPRFFQGAPGGVEGRAADTMAMVKGEKPKPMPPRNCFGFDKFLFDRVEHP